jgi:hypothetical protein
MQKLSTQIPGLSHGNYFDLLITGTFTITYRLTYILQALRKVQCRIIPFELKRIFLECFSVSRGGALAI